MTGSAERTPGRAVATNPFVGPRPLEPGEPLWGRDREIRELDDILSAERIVLLCSPSGAGKSSLVQAGLAPRLKNAFDVWGPTRVSHETADATEAEGNRYVLSAIRGFEQGVPERLRRPSETLARQTLEEYVEKRPRRRSAAANRLLIFDQFEEILTADVLDFEAKREFFDQLGAVLRRPEIWALLILREDYLVALDPFAEQVPTHLRHRYRLDLLGLHGARDAMVRTAESAGRDLLIADRLVRDLATVKIQQPDGTFIEEIGRHVEPVQLQVVCRRLWDALPAHATSITEEDLDRFGDVDKALAGYYADSVERVAAGDAARLRQIRSWFGERLITAEGIRGQVLMGAGASEGLDNDVIRALLDTHLVRAENRAGSVWYELAHDRLIAPVREDNAAWRSENLSEFQQRAELWERQGRPSSLLLERAELAAALRKAEHSVVLTPLEAAYLQASQKHQDQERDKARKALWIRRLGIAALLFGVIAAAFSVVAWRALNAAQQQRSKAEGLKIEAETQSALARSQSREAYRQKKIAEEERDVADLQRRLAEEKEREANAAQEQAAQQRKTAEREKERALNAEELALNKEKEAAIERDRALAAEQTAKEQQELAFEARREAEASGRESRRLHLLAESETLAAKTLTMHQESLHELAGLLAIQAYRVQAAQGGRESPQVYQALRRAVDQLGSRNTLLAFERATAIRVLAAMPDPQERMIVAGSDDGEILRLRFDRGGLQRDGILLSRGVADGIRAMTFDAEGRLVAGTLRGRLYLWSDVRGSRPAAPTLLPSREPSATALAFSTPTYAVDGPAVKDSDAGRAADAPLLLAVGRGDGSVDLYDQRNEFQTLRSGLSRHAIRGLAFLPDGRLAIGVEIGVLLTSLDGSAQDVLLETPTEVLALAAHPNGDLLAAGTSGGLIYAWDSSRPDAQPLELRGHTARISALQFHWAERRVLTSSSFDGDLRIWGSIDSRVDYDWRTTPVPQIPFAGHESWVHSVRFTADGGHLVSGDQQGILRLWPSGRELIEHICRLVSRDLTPKERAENLPEQFPNQPTCQEPSS